MRLICISCDAFVFLWGFPLRDGKVQYAGNVVVDVLAFWLLVSLLRTISRMAVPWLYPWIMVKVKKHRAKFIKLLIERSACQHFGPWTSMLTESLPEEGRKCWFTCLRHWVSRRQPRLKDSSLGPPEMYLLFSDLSYHRHSQKQQKAGLN